MRSLTVDECSVVSGGLLQQKEPFGNFGNELDPSNWSLGPLAYLLDKQSGGKGKCVTVTTDSNGNQTVNIIADCSGGASSSISGGGPGSWVGPVLAGGGLTGFTIGAGYGTLLGSAEAAHLLGIGGRYALSAGMIALCETPYAAAMLGATFGLGIASIIVIAGVTTYYVVSSNGN